MRSLLSFFQSSEKRPSARLLEWKKYVAQMGARLLANTEGGYAPDYQLEHDYQQTLEKIHFVEEEYKAYQENKEMTNQLQIFSQDEEMLGKLLGKHFGNTKPQKPPFISFK